MIVLLLTLDPEPQRHGTFIPGPLNAGYCSSRWNAISIAVPYGTARFDAVNNEDRPVEPVQDQIPVQGLRHAFTSFHAYNPPASPARVKIRHFSLHSLPSKAYSTCRTFSSKDLSQRICIEESFLGRVRKTDRGFFRGCLTFTCK